MPQVAGSATRQSGVYVPAMSTKIIEWSRRCMTSLACTEWARRWYAAEVPNRARTLTTYTTALTLPTAR